MATLSAETHAGLLKLAERQFQLVLAVRFGCTFGSQPLKVPSVIQYGRKVVTDDDVALTSDEADEAAAVLEHTATFTLALQMVQAMKDAFVTPRNHSDQDVRAAFEISRLLRNAYAHQPFRPHWSIGPECQNTVYEVTNIARLDTTDLQGQRVRWQDYGGKLALFWLSRYVRSVIWPAEPVTLSPAR
jgi:hypothetical protein